MLIDDHEDDHAYDHAHAHDLDHDHEDDIAHEDDDDAQQWGFAYMQLVWIRV